jgi:hypothetical protein
MGAQVAVRGTQPSTYIDLEHFAQEIAVKIELKPVGERVTRWVIFGRVVITNADHDSQDAAARIVHDANVVLDTINIYARPGTVNCLAVQATLLSDRVETVTLTAATYKGDAASGSLIAFNVDQFLP